MLKESSEEQQNNSAEKFGMNGSLWAERCPAPHCCTKRKQAEGTVILPLRSGAAGAGASAGFIPQAARSKEAGS